MIYPVLSALADRRTGAICCNKILGEGNCGIFFFFSYKSLVSSLIILGIAMNLTQSLSHMLYKCTLNLKGGLHQKIRNFFFVSNDTMNGPESRKIIFLNIKISVTVKIHPLCTSGSQRKFKLGPWGAVYMTT